MCTSQDSIPQRDGWDKFRIVSTSIALILVPIIIGIYGHQINSTLKQRDIESKYIEIAVTVLREQPRKDTSALREWAINIIRSYSEIPMDHLAVQELKKRPLPGRAYLRDESGDVITDESGDIITDGSGKPSF